MNRIARPIKILLVEDNESDLLLTQEALKEGKVQTTLSHVWDGVEAGEFLLRRGRFKDAARPDLILLDINLPRKNGMELLAEIKADDKLKQIPVVILTTSRAEEDILRSYELHANCYITKPVGLSQFVKIVQAIDDFWFTVVTLPPEKE